MQLTVPNVRDAKRLRNLFHSLDYAPQKVHWLVNRYQKSSELGLDSLEQTGFTIDNPAAQGGCACGNSFH